MEPDPYDDRLIFLVGLARQALYTQLDKALLEKGRITTAQAGALFFLLQNNGSLLIELTRGLKLDKSAITRMVDRLEKKKLVERSPCQHDSRAVRVYLTKTGRMVAERCLSTVKSHNQAIKEGFSAQEIRSFSKILQTLIQRFSKK